MKYNVLIQRLDVASVDAHSRDKVLSLRYKPKCQVVEQVAEFINTLRTTETLSIEIIPLVCKKKGI